MIRSSAIGASAIECDVAIVGAGIAGLVLATRLAAAGKSVVVLESGLERQVEDHHPLNDVEQVGNRYAGASDGRFRCLGGTSTRWGGALIPFAVSDFTFQLPGWDSHWAGAGLELLERIPAVERLFGLPPSPYEDGDIEPLTAPDCRFAPRSAKWPPFGARNVAALLAQELLAQGGPEVVLDATVNSFEWKPDGRLGQIRAVSTSGASLAVKAGEFVLAAGAIESTRLLLAADRSTNGEAFARHDVLGRYFYDHLGSAPFALRPLDRIGLNLVAGFRFEQRGMRNLRFEPDEATRRRHALPASFAHIAFVTSPESGFALLREVMRTVQQRELPALGLMFKLGRSSPWLARALWWRFARHRLLYPADADIRFNVVLEQEPTRNSRITLADRADLTGVPIARIDWRIGDHDRASMRQTSTLLEQAWQTSPYSKLATIEASPDCVDDLGETGGVFHPGGSTRIAATNREGVVDRDLRCFAVPNLSVAATSVFPTGGGANPTMMLVAAAIRLAERLSRPV